MAALARYFRAYPQQAEYDAANSFRIGQIVVPGQIMNGNDRWGSDHSHSRRNRQRRKQVNVVTGGPTGEYWVEPRDYGTGIGTARST
jgi:hypothetical protein